MPNDHLALHRSGEPAAGEYRCLECGYGLVSFSLLPACPMCHGNHFQEAVASPFAPRAARSRAELAGELTLGPHDRYLGDDWRRSSFGT